MAAVLEMIFLHLHLYAEHYELLLRHLKYPLVVVVHPLAEFSIQQRHGLDEISENYSINITPL